MEVGGGSRAPQSKSIVNITTFTALLVLSAQ